MTAPAASRSRRCSRTSRDGCGWATTAASTCGRPRLVCKKCLHSIATRWARLTRYCRQACAGDRRRKPALAGTRGLGATANPAFAGNGGKRIALNALGIPAGRSCLMLVQMGRKPLVPAELTRKPFTVAEARRAGLRPWHLAGASWRRLGPATYVWAGLPQTHMQRLGAALRRLPPGAAFSGLTAAWLHGI